MGSRANLDALQTNGFLVKIIIIFLCSLHILLREERERERERMEGNQSEGIEIQWIKLNEFNWQEKREFLRCTMKLSLRKC